MGSIRGRRGFGPRSLRAPLGGGARLVPFASLLIARFTAKLGVESSAGVAAADGATVQFWKDQSGNSRDAAQATAGRRPIYRATLGASGLPSVELKEDTLVRYLDTTTFPASTATRTIFVVGDPGAGISGYAYDNISANQGSLYQGGLRLYAGSAACLVEVPSGFYVDQAVWNGASSRHRAGPGPDITGDPGSNAMVQLRLGWYGWVGGTGVHSYDGQMCEVLVYSGALTIAQCDEVRRWLNDSWGLPQSSQVMFTGDSITAGSVADSAQWRARVQSDFDGLGASGLRYYATGPIASASVAFTGDRCLAGGGATTLTVVADMATYGIGSTYLPTVIPVLIGTNDLSGGATTATLATRYGDMLDDMASRCPSALIIAQKLMPRDDPPNDAKVTDWNDNYHAGVVAAAVSRGVNVVSDDTLATLPGVTYLDGLHPDAASGPAMGDAMFAMLRSRVGALS